MYRTCTQTWLKQALGVKPYNCMFGTRCFCCSQKGFGRYQINLPDHYHAAALTSPPGHPLQPWVAAFKVSTCEDWSGLSPVPLHGLRCLPLPRVFAAPAPRVKTQDQAMKGSNYRRSLGGLNTNCAVAQLVTLFCRALRKRQEPIQIPRRERKPPRHPSAAEQATPAQSRNPLRTLGAPRPRRRSAWSCSSSSRPARSEALSQDSLSPGLGSLRAKLLHAVRELWCVA